MSRDRASAYADAVKRALPHALQVADRYHLVQNLREHLQRFLDHKRTCLPVVEEILLKEDLLDDSGSTGSLADQTQASALLPSAEGSQAEGADQQMSGIQPELLQTARPCCKIFLSYERRNKVATTTPIRPIIPCTCSVFGVAALLATIAGIQLCCIDATRPDAGSNNNKEVLS